MIRPVTPLDTTVLVQLTDDTGMFREEEIQALREVLDDYFSANHEHGHRCEVWQAPGDPILGYVYYAPAAMTDRTWYLYWIAIRAERQGAGLGSRLLAHVEESIRKEAGRVLFVETSSLETYTPTRNFYLKNGYEINGQLRDFYRDGDDMVVFRKRINDERAPV